MVDEAVRTSSSRHNEVDEVKRDIGKGLEKRICGREL